MNKYEKICAIIFRFAGLLSILFGIFSFTHLIFVSLIPNYPEKYTTGQSIGSGVFYTILGVIIFCISKLLARLVCVKIES